MSRTNKNTPTTAQGATPATKKDSATKRPVGQKKRLHKLNGWIPLYISFGEEENGDYLLGLGLGEEPVFDLWEIMEGDGVMEAFESMCDSGSGDISIPASKAREVRGWMFDWCEKVYHNRKRAYRDDED